MLILLFLSSLFSFQVPSLKAPVNDYAKIFSSDFKQAWNPVLKGLDQNSQVQIAILTVDTIGQEAIESASIQVVDKWQLGDSKSDKGLLFLIAKKERKIRIEVGQGLEGDLPDARANQIIEDIILPQFKKGNFDLGMHQGLLQSLQLLNINLNQLGASLPKKSKANSSSKNWMRLIFSILFLITLSRLRFSKRRSSVLAAGLILGSMAGGSRSRGGFGGGGFGGGFGGGGGGFSGGGASGSW